MNEWIWYLVISTRIKVHEQLETLALFLPSVFSYVAYSDICHINKHIDGSIYYKRKWIHNYYRTKTSNWLGYLWKRKERKKKKPCSWSNILVTLWTDVTSKKSSRLERERKKNRGRNQDKIELGYCSTCVVYTVL